MADSRSRADLIDPASLAALGRIEIIARWVVEGFLTGLHRSPRKGFSVEFAEHRIQIAKHRELSDPRRHQVKARGGLAAAEHEFHAGERRKDARGPAFIGWALQVHPRRPAEPAMMLEVRVALC